MSFEYRVLIEENPEQLEKQLNYHGAKGFREKKIWRNRDSGELVVIMERLRERRE